MIIPKNDPAGLEGMERWREALMAGDNLRVLRLPAKVAGRKVKDINELAQIECGEEIFADLMRRRLTGSQAR